MSQQTYPVKCECGIVHQCPAGYAGSKFACPCGKVVEVPVLSELRRSVWRVRGNVSRVVPAPGVELDAELEIGSRLRRGKLPVETACVFCQEQTRNAVPLTVECERERYGYGLQQCLILLIPPLTPIGLIVLLVRSQFQTARDVAFHLPVRVCENCQPTVFTDEGAKQALQASPLYARLLKQYPAATVSSAGLDPKSPSPGAMYRRRERRMLSWTIGTVAGFIVFLCAMIGGWGLIELTLISATGGDRLKVAEWEGWRRLGMFVLSASVGVLAGVGVGRLTAGIHRHFWPDPKAE